MGTFRRVISLGDIHGRFIELKLLYQQLLDNAFDPRLDQFITLGDYCDYGADTKKVIQWLIDKQKEFNIDGKQHFISLLGNHDQMLLDALDPLHPIYKDNPSLWLDQGGDETLKSYNPKLRKISKKAFLKAREKPEFYLDSEHIKWLRTLPLLYVDVDYTYVHGGLPQEPIEVILQKLQQNDPQTIHDLLWLRNEFIYSSYDWGTRVIFAHTPSAEPIVMKNKVGLNTMHHRNEGKLTALEVPSLKFYYQPLT